MTFYRAYVLDDQGNILLSEDMQADDDAAAVAAGWQLVIAHRRTRPPLPEALKYGGAIDWSSALIRDQGEEPVPKIARHSECVGVVQSSFYLARPKLARGSKRRASFSLNRDFARERVTASVLG